MGGRANKRISQLLLGYLRKACKFCRPEYHFSFSNRIRVLSPTKKHNLEPSLVHQTSKKPAIQHLFEQENGKKGRKYYLPLVKKTKSNFFASQKRTEKASQSSRMIFMFSKCFSSSLHLTSHYGAVWERKRKRKIFLRSEIMNFHIVCDTC